ncbi:MAG: hypothetical protein HYV09_03390 [Deltaproteobacteria bacterium]|nr:hypothetical protein [Deltaproteobacteria bacterium]
MPIEYPLINGFRYDFSSIVFHINGDLVLGVKEIAYKNSRERGEVRGTALQRLAKTRGQYKCEASCTLFRREFDELIVTLGDGYQDIVFPITVSYANDGQPLVTDTVVGCTLDEDDHSNSAGTDPTEVKVTLNPMYILMNGIAPFKGLMR